ncbi:feruloyl-CoA synthase [Modicisalibacter luteus]|uniref:feruloyl-CoA synthase n=1 Tax=Modicisalibacter luteus TaxID=453962 RepID=UPI0036287C75
MPPENGRMLDNNTKRDPNGEIYRLDNGTIGNYPRCMTERLLLWAEARPNSIFLAQREGDERRWKNLTFDEAASLMLRLSQALLDHGLSVERPLMVMSGNDIQHALLACAAMHVGIPYVPVSPSYALLASDYAKLRYVCDLVTPGMVFVDDETRFATALEAVCGGDIAIVSTHVSARARAFSSLAETQLSGDKVERAHASVSPDSVAKLLFTSGSTGMPKAVINTQRMLCSNQAMLAQQLPFLQQETPVLVDWLPWHHTFGGNTILGMAIHNGGSLYIDDGSPTPQGVQRTVDNLREISPTFYCNVPKGFEALVDHLRKDDTLRSSFFQRLEMMHFGGAVLPAHVRKALDDLGYAETGQRIPMLTGLGSTEACLAFCTDDDSAISGLVGRPVPGMQVKLVPSGNKWEARLKGLNVTPGYWRAPDKTAEAFDEEGYYCTGDAMRFIDPQRPESGLIFDGRLSENFKLITGTWVNVGVLRLQVIEDLAPVVQDVVIIGEGQGYLTGFVVLNPAGCAQQLGAGPDQDVATLSHSPALRDFLMERLTAHRQGKSSSMRLERLLVLDFLSPSIKAKSRIKALSTNVRSAKAIRT